MTSGVWCCRFETDFLSACRLRKTKRWKLWMLHENHKLVILRIFSFTEIYLFIVFVRSFCVPSELDSINLIVLDKIKPGSVLSALWFPSGLVLEALESKGSRYREREKWMKSVWNWIWRALLPLQQWKYLNNVQLSIGYGQRSPPRALPLPNYIWPFPFPAETALLFTLLRFSRVYL